MSDTMKQGTGGKLMVGFAVAGFVASLTAVTIGTFWCPLLFWAVFGFGQDVPCSGHGLTRGKFEAAVLATTLMRGWASFFVVAWLKGHAINENFAVIGGIVAVGVITMSLSMWGVLYINMMLDDAFEQGIVRGNTVGRLEAYIEDKGV